MDGFNDGLSCVSITFILLLAGRDGKGFKDRVTMLRASDVWDVYRIVGEGDARGAAKPCVASANAS